jgi:hypothetical protein
MVATKRSATRWLCPAALAQASGLTVRALHHYEQIGLLRPSRRPRPATGSTTPPTWHGCTGSAGCGAWASRSIRSRLSSTTPSGSCC